MSCPSCVFHITQGLKALDGVQTVDVKLKEGRVVVSHGPEAAIAELVGALSDAGYVSLPEGR